MTVIKIQEGDIIEAESGIYQWIVKTDYFAQPYLELQPYDDEAEDRHMEDMRINCPEWFKGRENWREVRDRRRLEKIQ